MKKYLFIIFLFSCFTSNGQDTSTYPARPSTQFNQLDVHGNYVVASGNCDLIWTSKDGGLTWNIHDLGYLSLKPINILPNQPTRALISIGGGLKLFDMDEGIIDSYDDEGLGNAIRNIKIHGDEIYILSNNGLYKSSVDNISWERIWEGNIDVYGSPRVMDVTDQYVYFNTKNGHVFRYQKSNQATIEVVNLGADMTELSMGTDNHGVAVVSGIFKPVRTTDGWVTSYELDEFAFSRNVHSGGENNIIVTIGSFFEISTDGGETVVNKSVDNNIYLGNIKNAFFEDEQTIYIYGCAATLAKSIDLGDSWIIGNPYERAHFAVIDINKNGVGFAGGQFGHMASTLDYGNTWITYDPGISFSSDINGLAVMENGDIIIATNDNIYTIRDEEVIYSTEANTVRLFKDPENNFVLTEVNVDGQYEIQRSEDSGETWSKVHQLPKFSSGFLLADTGDIYMVTNYGSSYNVSTDDGLTWSTLDITLEAENLTVIDSVMYASSFNNLYKSEDDGQSWAEIFSEYGISYPQLGPDDNLYLTTIRNGTTALHMSEDNGSTWSVVWNFCEAPNQIILTEEGKFVIAHQHGHLNIYSVPVINSVENHNKVIKNELVYPNPLKSGGKLFIKNGFDYAEILNMDGRKVSYHPNPNNEIVLPNSLSGTYVIRYIQDGNSNSQFIFIY